MEFRDLIMRYGDFKINEDIIIEEVIGTLAQLIIDIVDIVDILIEGIINILAY